VKIGAGFCGENFAANEAGILDVLRITPTVGWAILSLRKQCFLFLGAMLENLFDANWTIFLYAINVIIPMLRFAPIGINSITRFFSKTTISLT
jgi:hypothetical protein